MTSSALSPRRSQTAAAPSPTTMFSRQPARHRSASPPSPPRRLGCGSRRGIVKALIATLADFAALDPFFRIIEQGLDGLAGPGHFFDILAEDGVFEYVITVPRYRRPVAGR